MAISGAQPRARIARAIWAYTLMDQRTLADTAGVKYSRLRAIMARENPDEASLDELLALARAADIPEDFALNGFAEQVAIEQRIAALEEALSLGQQDRDLIAREVEAISETLERRFGELAAQALEPHAQPPRAADRRRGA